nr:DUF3168 domain-containing protein [uncultured Psychrobacter sp.]
MSVLPIYRTLKADTALAELIDVESQVFEDVAPFGTPAPYIVWQVISGQANNYLDAPASFDDTQFQVIVYATDTKQAYELRAAIRAVIEQHAWILNPSINQYDNEAKLYGRGFDANWILAR